MFGPRATVLKLSPALAALAAVCLAAGCVHAPPTPDAQAVDSLRIEGTQALKEGDIKKKILTTESPWWPAWLPVVGSVSWFDPSAWQADLRRITRFYEANGYYQVRIIEEQVAEPLPGHVRLLVKVKEGDPARITTLNLLGLDGLPADHQATVRAALPLKRLGLFLEDEWAEAKRAVSASLRSLGYAEVVVQGEALVEAEKASVEATLRIEPGQRYRFGQIFVATDPGAVVPPKLISQAALTDVHPGDWYSEAALAEAQGRVFQMGVFGAVKVNRGAPNPEAGTVPVVIDVREAPFRSLRLGGGVGFDLIRNEVRATLEYTDRNIGLVRLFNRKELLDRLTVKAKLGWAFVPTVWHVATGAAGAKQAPIGRLLTEYEVPRVLGLRTLSFQSSIDLSRALDNAFDYYGGEGKVGVIWRPRNDVTVFPSLNAGIFSLNSPIAATSAAPGAALGCPTAPSICVVAFAEITAEWDRRDNKLEPREGFYAALSAQVGFSQTQGITPYLRIVPEVRGYQSFGPNKDFTLAGKLRGGTLVAEGNNSPIVARFFSGGSYMRGFNQRRLSPMAEVQVTGSDGVTQYQALPVGGNSLLELSLEARWNVWEDVVLAVFSDTGLVAAQPVGPTLDFARYLYTSVGLGVRYRTVLGPIRLDFGVRLPNVGGPQDIASQGSATLVPAKSGCFGFFESGATTYGGAREDLCAFHFSVGEAF